MTDRFVFFAASALAAALPVYAQSPPAFGVVSVRLHHQSGDFRSTRLQFLPGGRFVATNYPLQPLISVAWNLPFNYSARLTGGPDWTRSEGYDIEAKAPDNASRERMRLMLQTLLADRFKLAMRRETKELSVYAVVVEKNGPKLARSKIAEKDCPGDPSNGGIVCHVFTGGQGRGLHAQAVDMADLALYVENWAERPVIDKTGLKGLFAVETKGWQAVLPGPGASGREEGGGRVGSRRSANAFHRIRTDGAEARGTKITGRCIRNRARGKAVAELKAQEPIRPKVHRPIPHEFVLEALAALSPRTNPMFGCLAVYVGQKIVLVLRNKGDANGVDGAWLATTREHHESLRAEFPKLVMCFTQVAPMRCRGVDHRFLWSAKPRNRRESGRRRNPIVRPTPDPLPTITGVRHIPTFPNMRSIHVLGSSVTGWQLLAADAPDFEEAALRACELILARDPRIGKVPAKKRRKSV